MRSFARISAAALLALAAFGASAQQSRDYRIDVVAPAEESTVFSNSGDVPARVTVTPDLADGDQVELLVDGLPAAPPSGTLDFSLSGIVRGTHQIQARIIDSTGNVGSISPSSDFHVFHASRLFPGR